MQENNQGNKNDIKSEVKKIKVKEKVIEMKDWQRSNSIHIIGTHKEEK